SRSPPCGEPLPRAAAVGGAPIRIINRERAPLVLSLDARLESAVALTAIDDPFQMIGVTGIEEYQFRCVVARQLEVDRRAASRLRDVVDAVGARLDAQELEGDGAAALDGAAGANQHVARRTGPVFFDAARAIGKLPAAGEPGEILQRQGEGDFRKHSVRLLAFRDAE